MIKNENAKRFKLLWWVSIIEGSSLLLLLGIAVPLKYLADTPEMVQLLGPIHGATFILYLWLFLNTCAQEGWRKRYIMMGCAAAFIPFGGFFVSKLIQGIGKEQAMES
jgi:integral membrane protein